MPSGWDLTSSTCDDGSPISNVNVSAGETVTCTFVNKKRGQIVVVEDTQPNNGQDFSFSAGGGLSPSSFTLDDDNNPALETLMEALPEREIFAISGATRQGVDPLLEELWRMLAEQEKPGEAS